ncbi:carbohydrate ABC transporter permease, partial [bacterium]
AYGLRSLLNTLIIAGLSVAGTVLSSSLVAYGFARLRWPGRDWIFGLLLATMMLPDAVTMMPRFLTFRSLGWIDTLNPLWVPSFFASAFNVFLLRQFFMGIPREMDDAAKIDGCGPFTTWWRVMLPLVKPALAAVAVMTFLGSWRDFMGPLIYISSPEKMPLSYVLQLYNSAHGGEPGLLMAATTLVVLPVVVLFFFTQRYFVEGVALTGMGGR